MRKLQLKKKGINDSLILLIKLKKKKLNKLFFCKIIPIKNIIILNLKIILLYLKLGNLSNLNLILYIIKFLIFLLYMER